MQYEAIIMDLMSRIIQLEKEVEDLKKAHSMPGSACRTEGKTLTFPNDAIFENELPYKKKMTRENKKMTDIMIRMCYDAGEKLFKEKSAGNLTDGAVSKIASGLADQIVMETGANRNSMIMYIYAVCAMLEGEIFKRAISSKAIKIYFDIIFEKYGAQGLKKAIYATQKHIDYRRICGHNVDSVEDICNQYAHRY